MKVVDFLKAVNAQVGNGYWYGCYVPQVGTEALLASKSLQYPSQYTADYITRSRKWLGKPVADCVGLIKGIVWVGDFGGRYQAASDLSADGMYGRCLVKGTILAIPEKPGLLVWKSGHIGVYVGNGVVVESRGVDYGVVRTNLKDRPWTNWGECHLIDYSVPQVSDMEKRAIAAEAKAAKLETDIHAAQAMVAAQASQLTALRGDLAKARLDISDLQADAASVVEALRFLATKIGSTP